MFRNSAATFVALSLAFIPAVAMLAQDAEPAIAAYTFTSFDVPGAVTIHVPGISNGGVIAGNYTDSTGANKGFLRLASGRIISPIVEPNDTGNFTICEGVNKTGTVVGEYLDSLANTYRGFFLSKNVFTTYNYPGPYSTALLGINDSGNFTGIFGSSIAPNQGFISIAGTATPISYPGAVSTALQGINNNNASVGEWIDSSNVTHGLIRTASGTLKTYDVPGSTYTFTEGINDFGVVVGAYHDSAGLVRGFMLNKGVLSSIDYPAATETTIGAINNSGVFAGHYIDAGGLWHGYLAK